MWRIVLADPIGPAAIPRGRRASSSTTAERAGLIPCFFSASDATKGAVPARWRSLVVADDTIVDLPGLEFTGKALVGGAHVAQPRRRARR